MIPPSADDDWFCEKIRECSDSLFRFGISILLNVEDTNDAVQETIIIAYRKQHTLRDKDKFNCWIMKILSNVAYGMLRKRKGTYDIDTIDESPCRYDIIGKDIEKMDVKNAIKSLNNDLRSVIVLFYYENFSIKEISRILGVSEGVVKTRLFRGRMKLKNLIVSEN